MSSFFDEASLVMIPSGYKDQKVYSVKPLDGSGDLTFSRASSATRVQSDGLIEKVRTNLLLQSNTFSTTWANDNTTETSGQAGYDGTNNAWLISKSASGGSIYQTGLSSSSLQTFSLYAKQGTSTWISMTILGGSNPRTSFDLVNGVVGTLLGDAISAKIESVGNGWYRCSLVASVSGSGVYIYPSEGDGVTAATSGTLIIQNAQLEASDIATDYIATTTTAVSVGPVSGLPRLDYLNSSCPRLLLEPQRTNLALFSESYDNAAWGKANVTVTANAAVSPDGYTNADALVGNGVSDVHQVTQTRNTTGASIHSYSVYLKQGTERFAYLFLLGRTPTDDNSDVAYVDLQLGTIPVTTGSGSSATIDSVGNGWYRVTMQTSAYPTSTQIGLRIGVTTTAGTQVSTASGFIYLWGAQLELGAYATSYIPTLSTSVTRVADAASKTGISSLIGQTEGTLFVEFNYEGVANTAIGERIIAVSDGTSNNRITLLKNPTLGTLYFFVGSGGSTVINQITIAGTSIVGGGINKVAVAYKSGEYAIYFNGASVFTSSASAVPATTAFFVGTDETGSVQPLGGGISQALLFKTRLTNAQLAELTA